MAALLEALASDQPQEHDYEALADRLMGLGYAALAARWRSWSLLPPSLDLRREAVQELSLRLGLAEANVGPSDPPGRLDVELALQQAERWLQAGNGEAARECLATVARQTGLPPALCNHIGRLEEETGDTWQAERWYSTSLRQAPGQHLVWFSLARCLLNQEVWDEGLAASEQGLALSPEHPWGLKLRTRALLRLGAHRTLAYLAEHEALSSDIEPTHFPSKAQRIDRSRQRLARAAPPVPSMADRLLLRDQMATWPRFWLLLHGRSAGPLRVLRDAGLLPEGLILQPMASRDPLGVREALEGYPLDLGAEAAITDLPSLPTPGLVLIHRPPGAVLPVALAHVLVRGLPVLAPLGCLRAPFGASPLWQGWGWTLWSSSGKAAMPPVSS